jgi:hypothetical protein
VSEWVIVVNANSAIFQLYHDENKLIRWRWWGPLCTRQTLLSWIFIVLAHWNNSPRVDMSLHSDTLFWFRANQIMTVVPLTVSKNELQKHTYMLKKYLFKLHSVHQLCLNLCRDCIGGIMVSVLASSAVDRGFEPWLVKTKDYEIGICCFSAKHAAFNLGERAKTGWLGIRIMCPSGATYLPADCCFSELAL